ncbi:DNA polymerase III subunit beta [Mycoplasma sp. Mirounga ES2805-ORL]|uniref:DNA polymerase III subunit beta n=1 Tax=Mycoplasma sp. Mirounga ES2805-ORL TaxID=754514 RepID=UPI00197B67AE|nr:DNA polymerase III subunit beta [Mycoplasma sp. Mirounga ES2805-ORL]QSF13509.1 DNA polymerase III subunit beta [Mycoplasma sp. Mirounga ES2805-ORL]
MKFKINKTHLDEIFEIVSRYSDSINTNYSFRCVLINVDNQKITFTATNGILSIVKSIQVDNVNVKVEEIGSFLIQSNYFKNIIKKLSGEILIEKDDNDSSILIMAGNSKYTLTTSDISTFPVIDKIYSPKKIEINTDEFKKAIKSVSFATSQDNSLIYKCINFKFKKNSINLAATDTYRLAHYSIKQKTNIDEEFDISVNGKDVKELIPNDAPKNVTLFYNNIKFGIEYKDTTITSRIVELPYNDVEALFDVLDIKHKITIKKDILSDILNKVWIGNSDKNNKIEINVTKEFFKITNMLEEIGSFIAKTSDFELEGKSLDFDVNYNFIKDALSVYDDDIYILIDSDIKRILILSKSNNNTKQLITPMRR